MLKEGALQQQLRDSIVISRRIVKIFRYPYNHPFVDVINSALSMTNMQPLSDSFVRSVEPEYFRRFSVDNVFFRYVRRV